MKSQAKELNELKNMAKAWEVIEKRWAKAIHQ
jgi:hypothetical protein